MISVKEAFEAIKNGLEVPVATAEDKWYFPPVETHMIRSKHVAQTFKIQVARPPVRHGDTKPMPVVYVTDGNDVFTLFKEISHLMQLFGLNPFPSFILVGIGYPSDSMYAGQMLRVRDLVPPSQPNIDVEASKACLLLDGILLPEKGTKRSHGAEEFRNFIADELITLIDERYLTVPGDRTYFGHSGGGLFGLFTLCTQSHLFRNYIISSPGWLTYMGDDHGFRMVREFIASGKSLDGIRLYMSVGADEDFQPEYYTKPGSKYAGASLTADFYRMAALLKNAAIPGLEFMAEAIPGEVHISVWPIAFMHGVQAVFGMRRLSGMAY